MGLMRTAVKAGIAKKVWDEARKPHNQAKAKELFAKLTGKDEAPGAKASGRGRGRSKVTTRKPTGTGRRR